MKDVKALEDQLVSIQKQIDDLKNPTVKVGNWYKIWIDITSFEKDYVVIFVTGFVKGKNELLGYGFDLKGEWNDKYDGWCSGYPGLKKEKLSDQEVKDLLLAEAKKRGYKQGNFVNLGPSVRNSSSHLWADLNFITECVQCVFLGNEYIYIDGKWATMVQEVKLIIRLGEYEVELVPEKGRTSSYFKIGCKTIARDEVISLHKMMDRNNFETITIQSIVVSIDQIVAMLKMK